MKKIFHIALAVLFLPVCFAAGLVLYEELGSVNLLSRDQLHFFYGCIIYLIFHAVVFKPNKIYIFGHEMMHAIAAILSGGRVGSFKVSKTGGHITTSKSNIFISLAPYVFPFYTILVAIIYFVLIKIAGPFSVFSKPFLLLIGITLTFHIVLTIDFLKIRQTDLLGTGYLFSIELIYFTNILVIGFIFSILYKEINFRNLLNNLFITSKYAYIDIYRQLFL